MAKRNKITSRSKTPKLSMKELLQQIGQNPRGYLREIQHRISAFNYKKISLLDLIIELLKRIKKIRLLKLPGMKLVRKNWKAISQSWRTIMVLVLVFFASYYAIGGYLAENMDVDTEYKLNAEDSPLFETTESMSFLLKREVDDKMWTPNLPIIFPAYVLDNMPNFQMGIVSAVKDVAEVIKGFAQNTPAQQKDIKQAVKLLHYSPKIWLMSRSGKFNLAPSANAQYRKAAQLLQQYRKDGVFFAEADEVYMILQRVSKTLFKISDKNADRQREHSKDWFDRYCDDLFYFNRGYAFALWQISKVLGYDYKKILVRKNAYEDWTYYLSSLKKAAEFKPLIVRNGNPEALFAANHLLTQNYYLVRAAAAAERVANKLLREQ